MGPKRAASEPADTTEDTTGKRAKTHPFFAATKMKATVVTWRVVGGRTDGVLIGEYGSQTPGPKIAAFDFDDTITTTSGSHVFSKSPEDWQFVHKSRTKDTILDLVAKGFRIVVLSNQKGLLDEKKAKGSSKESIFKGKVQHVAASLGIPLLVMASLGDGEFRKPQTGMWDYVVENLNDGILPDLAESFYVGDAAGRPERVEAGKKVKKDHSAGDYRLALNIGIKFHLPETIYDVDPNALAHLPKWDFDPMNFEPPTKLFSPSDTPLIPEKLDGPELVLLVGPPASGKTSFTKTHLLPHGYVHVNQDTLKDRKKCVEATIAALKAGKSVAVDNTNPTAEVRKEYIAAAKQLGVTHIRAFHFTASFELCQHNNLARVKLTKGKGKGIERDKIPTMVFHTFNKNLVEPNAEKEGFVEVKKIHFVPDFKSDQEKAIWSRWYL